MYIILGLFFSCTSIDDEKTSTSVIEEIDELVLENLFTIPERPFDMSWDYDGSLLISADASGKLYRWDDVELVEEQGSYHDIQAVHVINQTLLYTTTDNGVTGALFSDGQEALSTQADDGTLFRWPVDLISLEDGTLLIADYMAGLIFSYESDGITQSFHAGSQTPQALAVIDEQIYIGGEDGIWFKEDLFTEAIRLDERSANGLAVYDGVVYGSNSQDGIFAVQGIASPLPDEIGRPSTLLIKENMLYVIDQVGRGIWKSDLSSSL